MPAAVAERMRRLFRGYEARHYFADFLNARRTTEGKLVPEYGAVNAAPTLAEFEAHLAGKKGLLIVPITPEGTAYWAKIDVDDYSIDAAKVAANVAAHRLPLVVELTKSGGVHLAFYPKRPWAGAKIREQMVTWAAELNFHAVEIFPKQDKLDPAKDSGSGINLPYFGGNTAKNYALSPTGQKLTVEEWLELIEKMDDSARPAAGTSNVESAADFLAQFWTEGQRDRLNIAVVGTLLRARIEESAVEALIEQVRAITDDLREPRKSVSSIAEAIATDAKKIPGFSKLIDPQEGLLNREQALELLRLMGAKPPANLITVQFTAPPRDWLTQAPDPLQYCVAPLLPERTVGLLVAEGGVGKTTFAMRCALAVATGRPFFDLVTRPGNVVYVALEDQLSSLRRRFYYLYQRELERLRREGATPERCQEFEELVLNKFQLVAGAGHQLYLVTLLGGVVVQSPQLPALIDKVPDETALIVLDPLARMNGAEENSNSTGTMMINAMELIVKEKGCAVLAPHHTGKAAAKEGDLSQYAARGASALVDAARSVIRLSQVGLEQASRWTNCPPELAEEGGVLQVTHAKSNEGRRHRGFFLRRQELDFELFVPELAEGARLPLLIIRKLWEWFKGRGSRPFAARDLESADRRREIFGGVKVARDDLREILEAAEARGELVKVPSPGEGEGRPAQRLSFRPGWVPPEEEI